jgi:hypothetical protein
MEHGEIQLAAGRGQQAEGRRQKSEVGGQTTEIMLWERLSPPASPERLAMAGRQPRSWDLNNFNGFNDLPLTAYCSLLTIYRLTI